MPGTTNKSKAIVTLEAYDKGIDLTIPKPKNPKRYKSDIISKNNASTLYSDPIKPFNGVPMSVFKMHMFGYLSYEEKLNLAKTCRIFYAPLMEDICAYFQKFLQWCCTKNSPCKLRIEPHMLHIIDTGIGITPLAVAYAASRNVLEVSSKHYCDPTVLTRIVGCIYKSGTIDHNVLTRKAKSNKTAIEAVPIQERVYLINNRITDRKSVV